MKHFIFVIFTALTFLVAFRVNAQNNDTYYISTGYRLAYMPDQKWGLNYAIQYAKDSVKTLALPKIRWTQGMQFSIGGYRKKGCNSNCRIVSK
jgi:hypothetical protein